MMSPETAQILVDGTLTVIWTLFWIVVIFGMIKILFLDE